MLSIINIEVNNLRKTPVLQLKQSNSHSTLYLLNEQIVPAKPVLDTRATDSIIKSGQKDTEASIPPADFYISLQWLSDPHSV